MKNERKYVFTDYKTIGRRLTNPYRIGVNTCLALCLFCFFYTVFFFDDAESVLFLVAGIIFGLVASIMRLKLNEIEMKIHEMGVERAWEEIKKAKK